MKRLTLLSGGANRELAEFRRVVTVFETASSSDDMIAVLRDHATRGERIESIDVIGHSRAPGFLVLGAWVLDDRPQTAATFKLRVKPWLERLGVRRIRFLGCSTAGTTRSRRALREIAEATSCEILGTTRGVSSRDCDASGFLSDHVAVRG